MAESERFSGKLIHPRVVGVAAALLIAPVATDLIYTETLRYEWNNFSIWLLTAGLILAAVAGLAFLADMTRRRVPAIAWDRFGGFTLAALLSLLNAFIHSRDAYTAVVPDGVALSVVAAVILVYLGWRGWSLRAVSRSGPTGATKFPSHSPEVHS